MSDNPPLRANRRLASLALLAALWPAAARASQAQPYRIGVVPQFDSRKTYDIWQPILLQLQARTGLRFELVGSPGIPAFEKQFSQSAFDFAYMNPYHAVLASANYVPLVRDIGTPLQGIIVVRRDSPLSGPLALQGKRMDFPAPNALAASLMTRAHLDALGVHVHARYVNTHSSVYLNVALGQSDAGGGVLQTLEDQPATVREQLRIIDRTAAVASHPLMAHKRVDPALRERVRAALLALGETAAGRALLQQVPIDRIGRASGDDYAALRRIGLDRFYVPN